MTKRIGNHFEVEDKGRVMEMVVVETPFIEIKAGKKKV